MGNLVSLLTAVLGKLIADEIKDLLPAIASRFASYAASLLPSDMQERYSEEWQSHLGEIAGSLSKTLAACGFIFAALKISYRTKLYELATRCFALVMLTFYRISLLPLWYLFRWLYEWSGDTPYAWEERENGKNIRVVVLPAQLRVEYLLRMALKLGPEMQNDNIMRLRHSYPYCFSHSVSRIQVIVIVFRFVFYPALVSIAGGGGDLKKFLDLTARCDVPVWR